MNVNHVEYKQDFKNESQQLQFVEIRKMVSINPAWNILTCASQNMDEEKLFAVKLFKLIHS